MAHKNFKNFDNKLNDMNVSRFNSAFFLSPIEFINNEPNKETNYMQNLENQSLKIDDEHEMDPIMHKKDNQTPRSIDTNLKNCLGQDLLKHLDESPMRQHKFPPSGGNQFSQNKNSFFYKKMQNSNSSKENESSLNMGKPNDESARLQQKLYKLSSIPGSNAQILKKRFNDDFFLAMPLRTEEAYFLYEKNLCKNFTSLEDHNKFYQLNSDLNRLQLLKAEIFENILGSKEDYFSFYMPLNKSKSFYFSCDYNKVLNGQSENFDNFYMGNDREKPEEELINLNTSDEFKNEFLEQNKNFNNFNYTQSSQNESSACKNINNLRKNKNAFNSHFDYENEDEGNIYSSIFSDHKIKKSNSTNLLGDFKHKIPFDPELFSSDNNNLERIFHSPNFYNYNASHSKEKHIFEAEENANENLNNNYNININQNNLYSYNKKNSLSNSNLKNLAQSTNASINLQPQGKFIGLLKMNQENQNIQNAEHLENLKNSSLKNKPKKIFEDSTSAYSSIQKNIPSFTPNSEFSREMQANNLINKNTKNSFLYPNYSDFSDAINIPNLSSGAGNKQNANLNAYSGKNLNANINNNSNKNQNKNEIIYENQHDYDSENYGMSNYEYGFENKNKNNNNFNNNNNKKDLYRDIEGEHIVNNFLNDEASFTANRRDKNDESFDNRNFETFDCCNIDSFINPGLSNAQKSGFHISAINNNNEDAILNVSEDKNNHNPLTNKLNNIIDKNFPNTGNPDFNQGRNSFSYRNNTFNPSSGLKTDIGPSAQKPALAISDDMCFYPKSIRSGVAAGNLNKIYPAENQNQNDKNNSTKNESLYNIIDNFKNFTNLSENNLRNPNRNPNNINSINNNFLNLNKNEFENKNNFFAQSSKALNNNLNIKFEPQNKREENNNNQLKQQKLNINQNNINENIENVSSSDVYPSSTSSYSQNMTLNNQAVNAKNMIQGANIQIGDKQNKQSSQSSQNKTGWVCAQCKNFNYEMRHKCNRCGKPQTRPLDLFNHNPNFSQIENFNPILNPSENDLISQNNLNQMKNQALNFNTIQNNKQLFSPQNKFNSMQPIPNPGLEDINNSFNTQNINNIQQKLKFGFDNQTHNPKFSQSQIYHAQSLNNLQQGSNENMFNNLSNYYNNNQGNENLSLNKNNFSKISSSNLNKTINNNKNNIAEGFSSGLPNLVQPNIAPGLQPINPKTVTNTKEMHNTKPLDPHVHGTFPYAGQGDSAQIRNNFPGFNGYSNINSFGRDDIGNSKVYPMNANNLQQQQQNLLNQNMMLKNSNQNNLQNNFYNRISNIKSPTNQNINPNLTTNANNFNLMNNDNQQENHAINNNNINANSNAFSNKNQVNISNAGNNPLSQLGNNMAQNKIINQQQQQFNLQNNLNNFSNMNNMNNLANQLPIANKLGGFANINFANDFKKKYTPLDNLRLQNPSLNLINSPQINASLTVDNKENLANAQNSNLKAKVIGVNNLFDMNLQENLRNLSLQNAQNPILNKVVSDKKQTVLENIPGQNKQQFSNASKTNISTLDKSLENNLNKQNSPNKDIMSSSVNTTMTQSSENFGRPSGLNFDSLTSTQNLNNLSNLTNLANMNLNPNLNLNSNDNINNNNNLNNLNAMNNLNLPMQQLAAENSANQDNKKKKKPFVERVGDWVCIKCKNLNFSFRVVCNRCQLTKAESDKLFEQYMKNLMNYVKINEIIQNQIMNYPHLNTNFINQVSNMDLNSQQGLSEFMIKNNMSLDANGNLVNNGANTAAVLPLQPEGFANNVNSDLNNLSNNVNNLNLNNNNNDDEEEINKEKENANVQQQSNANIDNSNLNVENINNNPNPKLNSNLGLNNNLENFGGNLISNNNPIKNNNNYPSLDEIISPNKNFKDDKQEPKNLDAPVNMNNQNQSTNANNKQISENKDNKKINSDSQTNQKEEKKEEAQKNKAENISSNTLEEPNTAVNPISNNTNVINNYNKNNYPETYSSAYDSSNNYSYNNSNKGSYYNSYYNQNKNYRNDYNDNTTTNRYYRNPNSKNINPNKYVNYDKRSNQYYKNSGFSSDVQNK